MRLFALAGAAPCVALDDGQSRVRRVLTRAGGLYFSQETTTGGDKTNSRTHLTGLDAFFFFFFLVYVYGFR